MATNPNNKMKTHYWICINPTGQMTDLKSVSWTRSASIKLCIKDTAMNWEQEFFTDKSKVLKTQRALEKAVHVPVDFEDDTDVQMVYEMNVFEVEICKAGILSMLNSKFSE